jgi:sugar O-acyltransferase (sialic acid O-acetyltransferase NeuD family)
VVEDLIIIGAGGTSRDIAEAVEDLNADGRRWNLLGFLDDDPAKQSTLVHDHPVLGTIEDASSRFRSARLIIGIANHRHPLARKSVVGRIGAARDRFATIVHPSAVVSRRATIGAGSAVLKIVTISPGAVVGEHVIVSHATAVDHEAVLHDYVTVAAHATIAGSATIFEGAYVGASSAILSSRTVGECAIVGIGAVVLNDVPARTTVLGNPARVWSRGRAGRPETLDASHSADPGAPGARPSKI